jgi:AhpD family alkylhydroperoxidase
MTTTKTVNYQVEIPEIVMALRHVHDVIDGHGFDRTIHHLVQLRASQMNRCGFCVKMHTREAREDGETSERLDRVIVWDHVGDFDEREQAALAWTEALTDLDGKTDFGALRARLRQSFSDQEIGALTATVAMINLWNRVNISAY